MKSHIKSISFPVQKKIFAPVFTGKTKIQIVVSKELYKEEKKYIKKMKENKKLSVY